MITMKKSHIVICAGVAFLLAMAFLFDIACGITAKEVREYRMMKYNVWVKYTGNPSKLTFVEWQYLSDDHRR